MKQAQQVDRNARRVVDLGSMGLGAPGGRPQRGVATWGLSRSAASSRHAAMPRHGGSAGGDELPAVLLNLESAR